MPSLKKIFCICGWKILQSIRYLLVVTVLLCWRRCEEGREEEDWSGREGVKPPISCVLQSPGRGRSVLTSHSQRERERETALTSQRVQCDSQRGSSNQAGSDQSDSLRLLLGLLVRSGSLLIILSVMWALWSVLVVVSNTQILQLHSSCLKLT